MFVETRPAQKCQLDQDPASQTVERIFAAAGCSMLRRCAHHCMCPPLFDFIISQPTTLRGASTHCSTTKTATSKIGNLPMKKMCGVSSVIPTTHYTVRIWLQLATKRQAISQHLLCSILSVLGCDNCSPLQLGTSNSSIVHLVWTQDWPVSEFCQWCLAGLIQNIISCGRQTLASACVCLRPWPQRMTPTM